MKLAVVGLRWEKFCKVAKGYVRLIEVWFGLGRSGI